jgi:hypothetical protein
MEPKLKKPTQKQPEARKPYAKPAIVRELELETKAGTSLPIFPDPFATPEIKP